MSEGTPDPESERDRLERETRAEFDRLTTPAPAPAAWKKWAALVLAVGLAIIGAFVGLSGAENFARSAGLAGVAGTYAVLQCDTNSSGRFGGTTTCHGEFVANSATPATGTHSSVPLDAGQHYQPWTSLSARYWMGRTSVTHFSDTTRGLAYAALGLCLILAGAFIAYGAIVGRGRRVKRSSPALIVLFTSMTAAGLIALVSALISKFS